MSPDPIRVAVIGMTGWSRAHHEAVRKLEDAGICRLICTSTRNIDACRTSAHQLGFAGRDVRIYEDYVKMLDEEGHRLDVVTIPSALPLHAEMHRACVDRGCPAYLEKPPTLDCAEFDGMLAIEANACKLTNVGFNYIVEHERQSLKQRLLAGELGAIRTVLYAGLWPEPRSTFERTYWVGRLVHEGRLLLDSPMGNPMSHYVHNVLFWAATDSLWSWAEVDHVEAELYRAIQLQGPDTIFVRASTAEGIQLRLAFSHACAGRLRQFERIICDEATLQYDYDTYFPSGYRIVWNDSISESADIEVRDLLPENLAAYFAYVRGETERPVTRLIDSGPFVRFYDLALVAGREIHQVPKQCMSAVAASGHHRPIAAIQHIDTAVDCFFSQGMLPSEQGLPWARQGGEASAADLKLLPSVVARMVAAAP